MSWIEKHVLELREYVGSDWITFGSEIEESTFASQAEEIGKETLGRDYNNRYVPKIGEMRSNALNSLTNYLCQISEIPNLKENSVEIRIRDKTHWINAYVSGKAIQELKKTNPGIVLKDLVHSFITLKLFYITYTFKNGFVLHVDSLLHHGCRPEDAEYGKVDVVININDPKCAKIATIEVLGILRNQLESYRKRVSLERAEELAEKFGTPKEKHFIITLSEHVKKAKNTADKKGTQLVYECAETPLQIDEIRKMIAPENAAANGHAQKTPKMEIAEQPTPQPPPFYADQNSADLSTAAANRESASEKQPTILQEIERVESYCSLSDFTKEDEEDAEEFSSVEEISETQASEMIVESLSHVKKLVPLSAYLMRKRKR